MIFGLRVLLLTSLWVGIFGYLKSTLTAMTSTATGLELFLSWVVLYRVWDYFERGIRALKHELDIDVHETREDHRHFVLGPGNLVKARDKGTATQDVSQRANGHAASSKQEAASAD
ncbi:MAG: hypothetical protein CME19_16430 [Gemmatimonadetes bacterium]|nr:hypothetical protein [Gemmatimonadota bacterium]